MGQPQMVLRPGLLAGLPRSGTTSTSTEVYSPWAGVTETTDRRSGPTVDRSTASPRAASAAAGIAQQLLQRAACNSTAATRHNLTVCT